MSKLALIILTLFNLGLIIPNKEICYVGKIKTNFANKDYISGLYIEFQIDTVVLAKTIVQEDGEFKITSKIDEEFDIYYRGNGIDKTYLQTIKPSQNDTIYLNLIIPQNYKKHAGKIVCPKCNNFDQTIPIIYGLKTIVIFTENQPFYTTFEGYGRKEIYDGGCSNSKISAKHFCKRDKVRF